MTTPPASTRNANWSWNTKGYEDLIAGAASGVVSRFVVAPFDVIKIRFQLQDTTSGTPKYTSVLGAARRITLEEGVRALWKGNISATAMAVPYSAVTFLTNQQFKSMVSSSNRTPMPGISIITGSLSGMCATLVSYPLDLMRTRFAAQHKNNVR